MTAILTDTFHSLDTSKWIPQGAPGAWRCGPDSTAPGGGKLVLSVADSDTGAPTMPPANYVNPHNPSACLISKASVSPGQDRFVGYWVRIPSAQPGLPSGRFPLFPRTAGHFIQFTEIYGAGYLGSPAVQLVINQIAGDTGNSVCLSRDAAYHFDEPWHTPLTLDVWHHVQIEDLIETNPTGALQVTWDGKPGPRLRYRTEGVENDTGPNHIYLALYRGKGQVPGRLAIEFAKFALGTSAADIA